MKRHSSAILLVVLAAGCRSASGVDPDRAAVRFGVVADIQYADKDTVGARRYRDSLAGWKRCVVAWNAEDLDFAIQLGDLIDGRPEPADTRRDLEYVLGVTAGLNHRLRHVIGNHCLEVPRDRLLRRLRLDSASYSFTANGWRFVVLDSLAVSVCGWPEESESYREAEARLAELEAAGRPNARSWNGGVGAEQLEWLTAELFAAAAAGERVVVFSHLPALEEASTAHHLLWDHAAVVELLARSGVVAAYFAGHDHAGGYALADGIHHVTLEGLVEADPETGAFGVVELYEDRIELLGSGAVTSRTLFLAPAPAP